MSTLWAVSTKNPDKYTGPLACPFDRSLALLIRLLAPLHSFTRSLTQSRACGAVNDYCWGHSAVEALFVSDWFTHKWCRLKTLREWKESMVRAWDPEIIGEGENPAGLWAETWNVTSSTVATNQRYWTFWQESNMQTSCFAVLMTWTFSPTSATYQ